MAVPAELQTDVQTDGGVPRDARAQVGAHTENDTRRYQTLL